MEIADSARRHAIADDDIRGHQCPVAAGPAADDRVLVIGADSSGRLLEIVVIDPEDDSTAIHAMPLRSKFYRCL